MYCVRDDSVPICLEAENNLLSINLEAPLGVYHVQIERGESDWFRILRSMPKDQTSYVSFGESAEINHPSALYKPYITKGMKYNLHIQAPKDSNLCFSSTAAFVSLISDVPHGFVNIRMDGDGFVKIASATQYINLSGNINFESIGLGQDLFLFAKNGRSTTSLKGKFSLAKIIVADNHRCSADLSGPIEHVRLESCNSAINFSCPSIGVGHFFSLGAESSIAVRSGFDVINAKIGDKAFLETNGDVGTYRLTCVSSSKWGHRGNIFYLESPNGNCGALVSVSKAGNLYTYGL